MVRNSKVRADGWSSHCVIVMQVHAEQQDANEIS